MSAGAPGGPAHPAGRARRELAVAVAGAGLSGGLALSAGGQTWAAVTVERLPPLPPTTEALVGGALVPLVPAGGLLLLAAAVALLAVRAGGRTVVGLLAAVAGGVLLWSGLCTAVAGIDPVAEVGAPPPGGSLVTEVHTGWPVLAAVAGLLAVSVGLLAVLRGRHWPAMGRRYERAPVASATRHGGGAAAGGSTAEDRAADAWRALDRGDDPTDDPGEGPGQDRAGGPGAPGGGPDGERPRRL